MESKKLTVQEREQEAIEAVKVAYPGHTVCINSHRNLLAVSLPDEYPSTVAGLRLDGLWSWFNGVICNGVDTISGNTWLEV